MAEIFKYGDGSNNMANEGGQYIEIYHVPTGRSVRFKALITEFTDTFTSEWETDTPFGRMDAIQNFKRTGRNISIGFDIVAYSLEEAIENTRKIGALAQFLYPAYDGSGQMSNSPLCKIQFKNWIAHAGKFSNAELNGLLGAIGGFSFSPDLESGIYAANEFNPNAASNIYAKKTTISFEFAVIHQHELGWNKSDKRWSFAKDGTDEEFPYGEYADAVDIPFGFTETPISIEQASDIPNDPKTERTQKALTDSKPQKKKEFLKKLRKPLTEEQKEAKKRRLAAAAAAREKRVQNAGGWDD